MALLGKLRTRSLRQLGICSQEPSSALGVSPWGLHEAQVLYVYKGRLATALASGPLRHALHALALLQLPSQPSWSECEPAMFLARLRYPGLAQVRLAWYALAHPSKGTASSVRLLNTKSSGDVYVVNSYQFNLCNSAMHQGTHEQGMPAQSLCQLVIRQAPSCIPGMPCMPIPHLQVAAQPFHPGFAPWQALLL